MNVRLVVPRRGDGGHRDRLWAWCRAKLERDFPDWPIVEGHHDDGPWNRPAAVNRGAEGAWDVAVVFDADVFLDADRVRQAVDRAHRTGRMVLPYDKRYMIGAAGTRAVLDEGFDGPFGKFETWDRYPAFCSSCNVIPRRLWDEIGGMDERFAGWGGDDDMLYAACNALAGVDRIPGIIRHLHHDWDPTRDGKSPRYRCTKLLAERYRNTSDVDEMRRLLAEPRTDDQIVVACLTNGTRDTLAKTVESADRMLSGPIGRKVIVADRCAPVFDGWDTVKVNGGSYMKATAKAYDVALGSGQPWIFFTEDDFTFDRPVDLSQLQTVMGREPRLAQMVLLRQAWYPEELEAGGLIQARQALGQHFRQRDGWVEHAAFWAQNPMLTTRDFMAAHPWPQRTGSENRFYRGIVDHDPWTVFGMWGQIGDPPLVTHIGVERANPKPNGY